MAAALEMVEAPLDLDRSRAAWERAILAARVFAVDPVGLGGLVLRARSGPVRTAWFTAFDAMAPTLRRLPPEIADDRLLGGLDLTATLKAGRPHYAKGLLAEAREDRAILVLPMAERCSNALSGRLAQAIDRDETALLCLEEGADPDERTPNALMDRSALWVDLDGIPLSFAKQANRGLPRERVREVWNTVTTPPNAADGLAKTAASLGILSLRAPLFALRTARALAALDGEKQVTDRHLELSAALVLAPRATRLPSQEVDDSAEPPEDQSDPSDTPGDRTQSQSDAPLEDKVLDAVHAILPPDLLAGSAVRSRSQSTAGGAGAKQAAPSHGRPAGACPGNPDGRQRLDVLATLRQAAPWQALRKRARPESRGIQVLPDDFRIKRYVRPAESVLIFVVDASGSAAAARLAEAKGAVELMLAEAYRRREKVALIAFRGTGAEILLPPTRALVAAKRKLAILPGGGGTPLANGLLAGLTLAKQIRRGGATPYLLILTDGRGNVGLDGAHGRSQAGDDAMIAAGAIAAAGIDTVLIDTANRPQRAAEALAAHMAGRYVPLPRADATRLTQAIRKATRVPS